MKNKLDRRGGTGVTARGDVPPEVSTFTIYTDGNSYNKTSFLTYFAIVFYCC